MTVQPKDIFTKQEITALGKCFELSLEDNFIFPHWEFSILTGFTIDEAREVVEHWPNISFTDETNLSVVQQILGNLLGYPHGQDEMLLNETGLRRDDVRILLNKLKSKKISQ